VGALKDLPVETVTGTVMQHTFKTDGSPISLSGSRYYF
jgi:hypothetical protein